MTADEGIKRLGPNLYAVRVTGLDQRTGNKRNLKRRVEGSLRDARSVRDELRAELSNPAGTPKRQQLAAYAHSWLARRDLKDQTRRRYGYALLHIIPALGDYFLDALTPDMIQDYVNRRTKQAAGYTVLNELRVLRTIAKDAHANRLTPMVFTDRVKAPKVARYTKANPNLLSADQFSLVFSHLPPKWKPMVLLLATTGLRWGEVSALQWSDITLTKVDGLTHGEATIIHGNDRGRLTTPKTAGSYRSVPLVPEVCFLLGARKTGPVFRSRTGKMYASSAPLLRALKKAEALAGIPFTVTVHGLRRTFNNLARQHTSREVLKSITGHSTDAMVEHYSFVGAEEKAASAARVVDALKGTKK